MQKIEMQALKETSRLVRNVRRDIQGANKVAEQLAARLAEIRELTDELPTVRHLGRLTASLDELNTSLANTAEYRQQVPTLDEVARAARHLDGDN